MSRKLFEREQTGLFSPLIDVVANGMAAMFVILVIYVTIADVSKPNKLYFLTDVEPPPAICGLPYLYVLPVTGGQGSRRFSFADTAAPDWLLLEESTGAIYGTPVCAAQTKSVKTLPFKVKVADEVSADSRTFALTLHPSVKPYPSAVPLLLLRPAGRLPDARRGTPYLEVIGASGGIQPYRWEISAGSLPAGLVLKDGVIVGTPEKAGRFRFETRTGHGTGSFTYLGKAFSWQAGEVRTQWDLEVMNDPRALPVIPLARVGEAYLGAVVALQLRPTERILVQGEVPGLVEDGGILSGTPTAAGRFPLRWHVVTGSNEPEDGTIASGKADLVVLPARPPTSVGGGTVHVTAGEPFGFSPAYQGLVEPVTLSARVDLPSKVAFAGTELEGVLSEPGYRRIAVTAVDALGKSVEGDLTIRSAPVPGSLKILVPKVVTLIVGDIDWRPGASGGEGVYRWSMEGDLPAGLVFSEAGLLSGTLSATGTWEALLRLEDKMTKKQTETKVRFHALRADDSPLRLATNSMPDALVGQFYAFDFASEGGIGSYRYELAGKLPEGMSFSEHGVRGTPLQRWRDEIKVSVFDLADQRDGPKVFKLAVVTPDATKPRVISKALPNATAGEPFALQLASEGGVGFHRWDLAGELPARLELQGGLISGVPTGGAVGDWPFTVWVHDELGQASPKVELVLRIVESWPMIAIVTNRLPDGEIGVGYRTNLEAMNCWGRCQWQIDPLPRGLGISGGVLTGEPNQEGKHRLIVKAVDEKGRTAQKEIVFVVAGKRPGQTPEAPPATTAVGSRSEPTDTKARNH